MIPVLVSTPVRLSASALSVEQAHAEAVVRHGIEEISDGAALTLADLFAGPDRPALTAMAAGETVLAESVLDDIFEARQAVSTLRDRKALDMLGTFLIDLIRTGRLDA